MCHEAWWREKRAREAEESREVWQDFEETRRRDEPLVPEERPEVVRADAEDEVVAAER